MTTTTPDQGITLPTDPDTADNPVAFTNFVGGVENRLVRRYTNLADRTARTTVTENAVTALASEDRLEVGDGANWVSLLQRSFFVAARMSADQALTVSSTTLQNITSLVAAMPTAGLFGFRAVLYFDGPTLGDIKFAFTWPVGVTNAKWSTIGPALAAAASVGDGVFGPVVTVSGTAINLGTAGAGLANASVAVIEGELTMGGTSGNLQLQAAQQTADAGTTTVRLGSKLWVWRIS